MNKKLYSKYIVILIIVIWTVIFLPYIYTPEIKLEKFHTKQTGRGELKLVICNPLNLSQLYNVTEWRARWPFRVMLNSTMPNNRSVNFSVSPQMLNITYFEITKINGTSSLLNITPSNYDMGTWNITITATDDWCSASQTFSMDVVLRNSAPVLNRTVDNVTWQQDRAISPYSLTEFFYDPEGDPMYFWAEQPSRILIDIDNVTSRVTYDPEPSWYGVRYTIFHACDPWDCNQSNIVKLNVTKAVYPTPYNPREPTGRFMCQEYWACSEWGECIDGFQARKCIDINNCGTAILKPHEQRSCTPIPPPPSRIVENITQPREERPEPIGPTCRDIARRPWFLMAGFILLALLTEIYTYHARRRKHAGRVIRSFVPYLISIAFVVLAIVDYFRWVCECPQDCAAVPWNMVLIATAIIFALLVVLRMKWISILKQIKSFYSGATRRKEVSKDLLKLRLIELEMKKDGPGQTYRKLEEHLRSLISSKFSIRYNFLIDELDIKLIDKKIDKNLRKKIRELFEEMEIVEKSIDERNVKKLLDKSKYVIKKLKKVKRGEILK